jgi:hypothetical protein
MPFAIVHIAFDDLHQSVMVVFAPLSIDPVVRMQLSSLGFH